MITLMYPKDDYMAEHIAEQISLNIEDVYVVPKKLRNYEVIRKKLERSKYIILLVFDPWIELDRLTRSDIKFVLQKGKNFIAVIPENYLLPFNSNINEIRYKPGDINDFSEKIKQGIDKIKNINKIIEEKGKVQNANREAILLLAVLSFLFILLLLYKKKN